MTEKWFETAFGTHYPLLYAHRDQAEAVQCLELLDRLVPFEKIPEAGILDLGCGDGRHLELLSRKGLDAVGLDLSGELLRFAGERKSWPSAPRLVRGDMRHLPFRAGSFSSVLSLFTAFGYFGPPAANRDPVREIAAVLTPAGHWYFDYFDGDRVRDELGSGEPRVRTREMGPLSVEEERWFNSDDSVVCKAVRLLPQPGKEADAAKLAIPASGLSYTEKVAVFTLDELKRMAAVEGLELIASAGGYQGQPLGQGSRWILVFRKNTKALKI